MQSLLQRLLLGNAGGGGGGNPTLNYNFVDGSAFPSDITFSRGTNATQFDSTGSLVYAPVNLLTFSEQFDNAASWAATGAGGTVTANQAVAPDGNTTADQLTFTANPVSGIRQNVTLTAVSHTLSCWMRSISGTATARLKYFNGTTDTFSSDFTLTTTWQRFSFTFTGVAVAGNISINNGTAGAIQNIYIWGAQVNPTPVLGGVTESLSTYYPTTASAYYGPRLDYDPATLAAQGLLIEEQRTNSIRNSTMQGAVAGTPGTLPTNWIVSAGGSGITRTLVGTGTENGITYIDFQFSGTGSGTAFQVINTETTTGIAAATGQTWSGSFYLKLVAGSTAGTNITMQLLELASGSGVVQNLSAALSPTTQNLASQRNAYSATLSGGGTITNLQQGLRLLFTNGVAVDITLRIGLPQLEQGAFATSVIPTTTTALTRNADVASVNTLSPWYNATASTIYGEWTNIAATMPSGGIQTVSNVNDTTGNNQQSLFQIQAASSKASANMFSGGVNAGRLDAGGAYSNATVKAAAAYAALDRAISVNGSAAVTSAVGALPTSVTRLELGSAFLANYLNGYLRRITYYPVRLADATLQQITT